jgi:glutamate synthase domain-containing protein 3
MLAEAEQGPVLGALEGIDEALLRAMIERHHELVGSARAAWVLERWQEVLPSF